MWKVLVVLGLAACGTSAPSQNERVQQLEARVAELERQLKQETAAINMHLVEAGIFRFRPGQANGLSGQYVPASR